MWLVTNKTRIGVGLATAGILAAFGATSCASEPPSTPAPTPAPTPQPPPPPPTPESVHANELGDVPVLMYHSITTTPTSVYDRTPQDFHAELQRLAAEGYTPITATDYATGRIDIPAGRHPVVLTFDDSSPTQFTMDASGQPAAHTATRILLDVAAQHPDFRPVATFYVFNPPFDEPGGGNSLRWLHEHGFEIGNHTVDHPNLGRVSDTETQHQIAGMQRIIGEHLPGVPVRTLALPLGVSPDQESLAVDGAAEGLTYHHDSVMLVGSNPAPSPWSADFDPTSVPRIRSQGTAGEDAQYGSTAWLDTLAAHPERRYTSDGDPTRVSTPTTSTEQPAVTVGDRLHHY